ncbi:MAG: indolepyruvate oxidoreductase subunit beta [Clostridia bacterium]
MTHRIDNILVSGVGGQGVILATDVIAEVFLRARFEVKKSEVHGMSQRGGSVVSHVRRGEEVHSPLIPAGNVDVLLAMESIEALRYVHTLKTDGFVIYDPVRIPPQAVTTGQSRYPADVQRRLKRHSDRVYRIPAGQIAAELGNSRVPNTVLLGALSVILDICSDLWVEALVDRVPEGAAEINVRALESGRQIMKQLGG